MNELKVFSNTEFGELGVMVIDGKEYFPATQCAALLGYKNAKDAIIRHCKGVVKYDLPTNGGTQTVNYIPEGDLYRLIVGSKLPAAEKFERWVFDEVLPSIRHNGGYIANIEELIAQTAAAVVSEVMKQIAPILKQSEQRKPKPNRRKGVFPSQGIIEQLDPDLRKQVDSMIISNQYSCQGIANYLIAHGVRLSQTAVNRYAHKHFWDNSEVSK